MKYWQIVGESKTLDGATVDMMLWDHRAQNWRRDRGDDGECTTFHAAKVRDEHFELARQDDSPEFRVSVKEFEIEYCPECGADSPAECICGSDE